MQDSAIFANPVTQPSRFSASRLAWPVLLIAFAIFCFTCVVTGLGLNFFLFESTVPMQVALDAKAADYVMPDLERIGGVTGWRQAAEIAAVNRVPMSSHLFPEVSAHLLAATPTCHFLEYVDWADALLREPIVVKDGHALIPTRPGNGMVWDEDAVKHHRLR